MPLAGPFACIAGWKSFALHRGIWHLRTTFIGMGAIKTAGQYVVVVALAHGLMSAAFVSAIMHISGGNGSDEMRGHLRLISVGSAVLSESVSSRSSSPANAGSRNSECA
ncbi:MAG: hypothetical protein H0T95_09045 [Chthoniobacterales bacterium]|nr:hypothetical protein [Chthoniobacterales bacterium]